MRQAGRPSNTEKSQWVDLSHRPARTLDEIRAATRRRHNVDAAVLFSDIVVPVHATVWYRCHTRTGQLRSNHAHAMIYNACRR